MNRRTFVAAATAGAVGASAGCLSGLIDDMTTFEASPIRVSEAAAGEAGYEYQGTTELVEEREFGGESVEVTNYLTEYTRTIDMPLDGFGEQPEAGVFAFVSTPQVRVAGEDFNPVGDMSEAELAEYIQKQYEQFELGDGIGGRAIQPDDIEGLDTIVSFQSYEGTATLQGETEIDVLLDIARAEDSGDHLVVAAVYPDDSDLPMETERERADTMTTGIQHGDDVEVDLQEDGESGE
ncbi:DUF6517 family protein [Haloterrigena alkaliphila]|uniref:Uncharacterized protein n=1 Tax=Haloterrigena alkaliphila TaxID=2816475 RepID=A0A8A2VEQ8_9EURY|nr:DUF6517 family protein [Haloterrigena alkaliphila]QSW98842.1 DUF6517 family protein [Haloterrigena alkaliphila]